MRQLKQYRASIDVLDEPDTLRQRLADDGYLYLPGLLPVERVIEVRHAILRTMAKAGWLEEGSDPLDARPDRPRTDQDDDWWDGYLAILAIEAFNRLAHEPPLLDVVGSLLGERVIVHPQKIARMCFPGSEYPTLPHQDFALIQGSGDTLTSWIPLGDCPRELGGLEVLTGSHKEGLRSMTFGQQGAGGMTIEGIAEDDPRWRTVDHYAAGDVLLVHCLTVHAAPVNNGDRLRLSGDFRFQSADEPIAPGTLLPTAFGQHTAGWWKLTDGWSTTRWCEVDQPVRIVSYSNDPLSTPASRFAQ